MKEIKTASYLKISSGQEVETIKVFIDGNEFNNWFGDRVLPNMKIGANVSFSREYDPFTKESTYEVIGVQDDMGRNIFPYEIDNLKDYFEDDIEAYVRKVDEIMDDRPTNNEPFLDEDQMSERGRNR